MQTVTLSVWLLDIFLWQQKPWNRDRYAVIRVKTKMDTKGKLTNIFSYECNSEESYEMATYGAIIATVSIAYVWATYKVYRHKFRVDLWRNIFSTFNPNLKTKFNTRKPFYTPVFSNTELPSSQSNQMLIKPCFCSQGKLNRTIHVWVRLWSASKNEKSYFRNTKKLRIEIDCENSSSTELSYPFDIWI